MASDNSIVLLINKRSNNGIRPIQSLYSIKQGSLTLKETLLRTRPFVPSIVYCQRHYQIQGQIIIDWLQPLLHNNAVITENLSQHDISDKIMKSCKQRSSGLIQSLHVVWFLNMAQNVARYNRREFHMYYILQSGRGIIKITLQYGPEVTGLRICMSCKSVNTILVQNIWRETHK